MTKWIVLPAALVAAAAFTVSIEAAPNGNGKSTSPKPTKTTTNAPAADHSAGSKAKGQKATTTTTAKGHGSSKNTSSTTTASTTTDTNPAPGTTTWQPTNPVAEKVMTKPNQLAKLKAVLPAGTDINAATAGFKNFGQLNAAVNVSQNLGIKFTDLKSAMTGITLDGKKTGEPTKSLGQAIHQFKPGVDAEAEAVKATKAADQ